MARTSDIVERVLAHQFAAQRYSSMALDEVNKGYRHVVRKTEFRAGQDSYDFDTVTSTESYDLPADFMKFVSLFNSDSRDPLHELSLRDYDDADASYGTPLHFAITGNTIMLNPIPNGVYNLALRYRTLPDALELDDDPITPEEYDDILVDYALWRLYLAEHDFEAAGVHQQLMDQGLINMRTDLNQDYQDTPQIVPGTWG